MKLKKKKKHRHQWRRVGSYLTVTERGIIKKCDICGEIKKLKGTLKESS
jgi:hypothetical protein